MLAAAAAPAPVPWPSPASIRFRRGAADGVGKLFLQSAQFGFQVGEQIRAHALLRRDELHAGFLDGPEFGQEISHDFRLRGRRLLRGIPGPQGQFPGLQGSGFLARGRLRLLPTLELGVRQTGESVRGGCGVGVITLGVAGAGAANWVPSGTLAGAAGSLWATAGPGASGAACSASGKGMLRPSGEACAAVSSSALGAGGSEAAAI